MQIPDIYNYLSTSRKDENYTEKFLNCIKILKEIILLERQNNIEKIFKLDYLKEEESTILKKINITNNKNLKILSDIFYSLTSVNPEKFNVKNLESNNFPYNLLISKSIFQDLDLIEKYMYLLNYLPYKEQKNDILFCIISKNNNISLYNYLLTKLEKN